METSKSQRQDEAAVAARRKFLANCGKFAVITPPVVSLLLSRSNQSYAQVCSGISRMESDPKRDRTSVA